MDTNNPTKNFTQIAEGTTLKADIKTDQSIRIAGIIDGNLHSNDKIILSSTGELKGNFVAKNIEVSGLVEGELHAKEKLTILGTARIEGKIFAKAFSIEEGAEVNADMHSGDEVHIDLENPEVLAKVSSENKADKSVPSDPTNDEESSVEENESTKEPATPDAAPKDSLTKASSTRFLSDIYIGIPGNSVSKEATSEILDAGKTLMETLGFQLEIFDEATHDPFFQHLTYLKKRKNDRENIYNIFEPGKDALEAVFMKKEHKKVSREVADAAKHLARSIGKVEEVVFVLGQISLVQVSEDSVQTVAVDMTSPALGKRLNANPRFVLKSQEVYNLLTS